MGRSSRHSVGTASIRRYRRTCFWFGPNSRSRHRRSIQRLCSRLALGLLHQPVDFRRAVPSILHHTAFQATATWHHFHPASSKRRLARNSAQHWHVRVVRTVLHFWRQCLGVERWADNCLHCCLRNPSRNLCRNPDLLHRDHGRGQTIPM